MSVILALIRRELGGYFKSLIGYVVIATVLFLFGFSFVDMLGKLNGIPQDAPVTEQFYSTVYFWVILLITAPMITMRAFALEKSTGTYETLMTAPVGDWQVVLAKFGGTLAFFALVWLPLLGCLFIIRHFTGDPATLDPRVTAGTFLGILLIGSLYMAMGCFASALTQSQTIAAMFSFLLGVALFVLSLRSAALSSSDKGWDMVLDYTSVMRHLADFSRGIVDTRQVVFYITATGFFLYLTQRVVESRRWK